MTTETSYSRFRKRVLENTQVVITKRSDAIGREFWKPTEDARKKVESWPEWKRNLRVTQFS